MTKEKAMGFEQTLARLEALKLFEEGIVRLREASASLSDAEGKVKTLIEQADGVFGTKD